MLQARPKTTGFEKGLQSITGHYCNSNPQQSVFQNKDELKMRLLNKLNI